MLIIHLIAQSLTLGLSYGSSVDDINTSVNGLSRLTDN